MHIRVHEMFHRLHSMLVLIIVAGIANSTIAAIQPLTPLLQFGFCAINCAVISPDGKTFLAVSGSSIKKVKLWNTGISDSFLSLKSLNLEANSVEFFPMAVKSIVLSPDEAKMLTAYYYSTATLCNLLTVLTGSNGTINIWSVSNVHSRVIKKTATTNAIIPVARDSTENHLSIQMPVFMQKEALIIFTATARIFLRKEIDTSAKTGKSIIFYQISSEFQKSKSCSIFYG